MRVMSTRWPEMQPEETKKDSVFLSMLCSQTLHVLFIPRERGRGRAPSAGENRQRVTNLFILSRSNSRRARWRRRTGGRRGKKGQLFASVRAERNCSAYRARVSFPSRGIRPRFIVLHDGGTERLSLVSINWKRRTILRWRMENGLILMHAYGRNRRDQEMEFIWAIMIATRESHKRIHIRSDAFVRSRLNKIFTKKKNIWCIRLICGSP